jgi:hypothetical protein
MVETKYGKYVTREPLEKGFRLVLHLCAENGCLGEHFSGFPVEV